MKTLIHISDLHFGKIHEQVLNCLKDSIFELKPDLIVVSGDLTQRARHEQFRQARAFLDSLLFHKLVVPGNHDVPLWDVFNRFFRPLNRYRHYINDDLCPLYEDDEISVQGISTAHAFTIAGGKVKTETLERALRHWTKIAKTKVKVLVTHHPFERLSHKSPVKRIGYRSHLPADVLLSLEADLLLSGHLHSGHSALSGDVLLDSHRHVVVVQAGTATSTRTRDEQNSFNRIIIDNEKMKVEKWLWIIEKRHFEQVTASRFKLGPKGWVSDKTRHLEPETAHSGAPK